MTTKYATQAIGRRAAENGLHAIRYAKEVGLPINTHVTISFAAIGIDDDRASGVFIELRKRLTRWWRYLVKTGRVQSPFVDVQAHANPAGSRHVHWVVHLPDSLSMADFRAAIAKRLRAVTGVQDLKDAVHINRAPAAGSLAKYIFRGIEPEYGPYLFIEPANEGLVTGRRTGVSRVISKAARRRAGWVRKKRKKAA